MIVDQHKRKHHYHEFPVIVITGFMGTGKTETAKELSKLIGFEFLDTDVLVERLAGCSISEIITKKGEAHFRALEASVCKQLYKKQGTVIATGGGTLLNEDIFRAFAGSGTVILLEASIESLLERLTADKTRPLLLMDTQGESKKELRERLSGDASRPLLGTDNQDETELQKRIRSLLEEREKAYGRIPFRIDTSHITPYVAACRIAAGIELPSAVYCIGTCLSREHPSKNVPVYTQKEGEHAGHNHQAAAVNRFNPGRSESIIAVGRGMLSKIGERLKSHDLAENVVLLMPEVVRKHFFPQIEVSLDAVGTPYHLIEIEDGESHKTLTDAARILDKIVEAGAGRDSTIVPVGGGVTGDIGGFVASLYMRGVHLVHVPTTLLAQVDSSIGGKTGVNHPKGKNLIGSFYQPDLVLSDPCTLRTLPLEQISNGMAEVIKTALLGSVELFEYIESQLAAGKDGALRNVAFLERCVNECVAVKGAIVEDDPFENDKRRILNLGHTVGHALEAACEYTMNHGHAVALGLIAALQIATERGMVEKRLLDRTTNLLKKCRLPVVFPRFDEEAFLRSLHLDKKRKRKRIHFVLPMGIGRVLIVDDVTADEILGSISKERS